MMCMVKLNTQFHFIIINCIIKGFFTVSIMAVLPPLERLFGLLCCNNFQGFAPITILLLFIHMEGSLETRVIVKASKIE